MTPQCLQIKSVVSNAIFHFFKLFLLQRHVDKTIYETRTSLLRKFQPPVDPAPLWHMPKFEKVS